MPLTIDFRARPNTDAVIASFGGPGPNRWGYETPPAGPLEAFVESARAHGIDRAVFTGRHRMIEGKPVGIDNDYVASSARRFPETIIGIASADPTAGQAAVRELRRAVEELGLMGLSVDPFMHEMHADDRRLYPLYEAAGELGVPVIVTLGPLVGAWGDPWPVDRIAADFPTIPFVCSHGCWPQVHEYLGLAYRRENVYLEPSIYWSLPGSEPFIEASKTFLADRVLYASAFPLNPLEIKDRFVEKYALSGELRDKIMGVNAARLLGLDASS